MLQTSSAMLQLTAQGPSQGVHSSDNIHHQYSAVNLINFVKEKLTKYICQHFLYYEDEALTSKVGRGGS